MKFLVLCVALVSATSASAFQGSSMNFSEAKRFLKSEIVRAGDLDYYCGCPIVKQGKKLAVDLQACGYEARTNPERAARIEFEHVVPASHFGRQLQCWQDGGRKNCTQSDPTFAAMEGDPHNLLPVVGEVNADRGNLKYGMVGQSEGFGYGMCGSRVSFEEKTFMPRKDAQGDIARINFYFADRYGMQLSRQQMQLFQAWDKTDPVDGRECERNKRIAATTGSSNKYVEAACRGR